MQTDFDVLVIGGGIIGASASHHMSSAGYTTLLVEQGDYASGTSSRTSRMHNCGFMYFMDAHKSVVNFLLNPVRLFKALELARRTMRERAAFVSTSPDRVRKLDFLIPFEPNGHITRLRMKLATKALQLLGGSEVSLEPRFLDALQASQHPLLGKMGEAKRLRGAFVFAEYQYAWPERIVLDTILKAREAGLVARNYTRVIALVHNGSAWCATLQSDEGTYSVTAKAIVNAAGAWVDHITHLASPRVPNLNSGAKGVNLLVRLPDEARGIGMETVTARGTPFYLMPWGDYHYLGPADAPADAANTEFRATENEINLILEDANQLLPSLKLSPEKVVYSWAGVRPRTASKGELLGSLEVREHDLTKQGLTNFFVFTGGLIMTHRDAGRRLLKAVQRYLRPSSQPRRIDYNLRSRKDEDKVTPASVLRAISEEQARSLTDILRRRLSVGWEPDLGLSQVANAAEIAAAALGWTAEEKARQIRAYRDEVERNFRPSHKFDYDERVGPGGRYGSDALNVGER
jgi:glycerol-3-phosphate dehydrogenase